MELYAGTNYLVRHVEERSHIVEGFSDDRDTAATLIAAVIRDLWVCGETSKNIVEVLPSALCFHRLHVQS